MPSSSHSPQPIGTMSKVFSPTISFCLPAVGVSSVAVYHGDSILRSRLCRVTAAFGNFRGRLRFRGVESSESDVDAARSLSVTGSSSGVNVRASDALMNMWSWLSEHSMSLMA